MFVVTGPFRRIPRRGEALRPLRVEQFIGGARGQADMPGRRRHAAAAGERGDERALALVGPARAAAAKARDGGKIDRGVVGVAGCGRVGVAWVEVREDNARGQLAWEFWFAHAFYHNLSGLCRKAVSGAAG